MLNTGINLATIVVLAIIANSCLVIGTDNPTTTIADTAPTEVSVTTTTVDIAPTEVSVTTTTVDIAPTEVSVTNTTVDIAPTEVSVTNTTANNAPTEAPVVTTRTTTQIVASTTTITTPPSREETNHRVKEISLNLLTVPVNLQIFYTNASYKSELDNVSSAIFQESSATYGRQLSQIYKHVEGFNRISINKFSYGSLGVDYTVHIDYPGTNWAHLQEQLEEIDDDLNNTENVILKGEKRIDALNLRLLSDPCQVPDVCPLDSVCEKTHEDVVTCTNKCEKTDIGCKNGGECVIDKNYNPICKCLTNDDYIYGGEKCEQKAEKLALSKENIIAIAGGTGGGVVLIFVIIIIVICAKKSSKVRPNDKVKDDASEQSFKDSEDGLHQNYKMSQVSNDVTFRSPGPEQTQMRQNPYTISTSSIQPSTRNPRDIVESYGSDYRFPMVRGPIVAMDTRKQSDAFDMRRQSRVRISEDVENSPDYYNRGPNRSRDSIDATNLRKNSNFNLLAQRRRSSVPADLRGPTFTRNPLYNMRRKSSVYMEIDDNDSKSVMYQPSNNTDYPLRQPMTPTTGKVYDYSNLRRESTVPNAMSPRLRAGSEIWDYDDDNRMYGYKKPVPAPRRYN